MVWSDRLRTFEAFEIIPTSVSDDLTLLDSVDVVDVSETGILIGIGIHQVAAALGGTPDSAIEITVDGGTLRSLSLYAGGIAWDSSGFRGLQNGNGDGKTSETIFVPFHSRYASSLKVSHNVTDPASSAGSIKIAVLRGVKI